jgi:hypothetical protein
MKKYSLFIILFLSSVLAQAQLSPDPFYIDYKIRTDDFYAQTQEDGFDVTYADPTWHFRNKVSSSYLSDSWSAFQCVNSTNGDASGDYQDGQWYAQPTVEQWSGKCLSNADNVYIDLEGWEEENGTPCTYETSDDDYSTDYDYDTDISGSHTRNVWRNFKNAQQSDVDYVDCGTEGSHGYYKVEFDVWWNYSIPVNPKFALSDANTKGFSISLTGYNNYRVTSWDYQISDDAGFNNIVASASGLLSETENVSGLADGTTYYVKIRGANEAGTGAYTNSKQITTLEPSVSFTLDTQSSTGETSVMILTAQLSEASVKDVTLPFIVNPSSTATGSGTDYTISASPITIPVGSTSSDIIITISEDAIDENDETVIVEMGTPINAVQGATSSHTATITDDDNPPEINFTSALQTSDNEAGILAIFAVLSSVSAKDVTLPFTVNSSSTATGGGTDYTITASPLTILAGNTSEGFTVSISEDVIDEENETVIIEMGTPVNAVLGTINTHTLTITDNDTAPLITTLAISTFDENSAIMGGNVTDEGTSSVTEQGVVYSTSDNTPTIGEGGVIKETHATSGTGTFSESISGLSPATTYYVQAYAISAADTSYGGIESFTTTSKPIINSASTVDFSENATGTVLDVQSTDANGDTEGSGLTYAFSTNTDGGFDNALFAIDADTGVITFIASPDFENASDADTNNDYEVQVTVTDSGSLIAVQDITITVTDVTETVTFTIDVISDANVDEKSVYTSVTPNLSGATPIGSVTYTLGGTDAAAFTINETTGVVGMVARDYENAEDANTDNVYELSITATDSDSNEASEAWTVTVDNVTETVTFTIDAISDANVDENSIYTSVKPNLSGATPIGSVTYTLGGTDAAAFTINETTGVVSMVARDYENAEDANTDNVYELSITATDSDSNQATEAWTVTVVDDDGAEVLAQIGLEGDNPDIVNSVVTIEQLNTITGLTSIVLANETAYQDYIDANPDDFSSPAILAEVQTMITAVNITLGVDKVEIARISLYPNPLSNQLHITSKKIINEVVIFNLIGQKIMSHEFNTDKVVLDVTSLSAGMYNIIIKSEKATKTVKIVKQ